MTIVFSGDRVNHYFADLELNWTQRNLTLVNHDNESLADREKSFHYLFVEQKH
jgi:hypothetical protein